jgi:hypothetical protein
MNEAGTLPTATRLTPHAVLAAWCAITGRQIVTTFLLGCGLQLLRVQALVGGDIPRIWPILFLADQIKAFSLLLAFVVADRVAGDPDRRGAYVVALVVGATVGVMGAMVATSFLLDALSILPPQSPSGAAFWLAFATLRPAIVAYYALQLMLLGAATFWVIIGRRRGLDARTRLHKAQLARIDVEKRGIESDLQAMQARVEPQFLLNTLAQVKALYEQDRARGARMLSQLIAYLRAAMPRMRDTSSTVGQEIDLVFAYLGIVRLRLGERLSLEIEAPRDTADVRMPSMMLLPLVDHAIAQGFSSPQSVGTIRIRTAISGGKLRLETINSGVGLLPRTDDGAISGIRERLHALFGGDASFELRAHEDGFTEGIMELPVVRAGAISSP